MLHTKYKYMHSKSKYILNKITWTSSATQIKTIVLSEIQVYGYGVPNLLENTNIHSISYSHDKKIFVRGLKFEG